MKKLITLLLACLAFADTGIVENAAYVDTNRWSLAHTPINGNHVFCTWNGSQVWPLRDYVYQGGYVVNKTNAWSPTDTIRCTYQY